MIAARNVSGSSALIDSDQIRDELATDINQLLKTVPGTYIREEDGYGLLPNIGIRGATSERSAKITLMEDGVLIAPAPYAAPEAYYFPTLARMQAVEVLKGASQLRYGPQTTGGVVNLVSTSQPDVPVGACNWFTVRITKRTYWPATAGRQVRLVSILKRPNVTTRDSSTLIVRIRTRAIRLKTMW